MSRPKSQATIDREIRRERRALKRQEKERRRAEREARLARHENAKQGAGVVGGQGEPCYAAMRTYHPWCFCEVGHHAVRENLMHDETCCFDCAEGGPIKAHVETLNAREQAMLFPQGE